MNRQGFVAAALFIHRYGAGPQTIERHLFNRTAGHPPPNTVPLTSGYNPDATVTKEVPGFGGDVRVKHG